LNQEKLDTEIRKLLDRFKETDPPEKSQLALPTAPFKWLAHEYQYFNVANPNILALADLMVLAFFFLLRVGEYICSSPAAQRKRRTVPLRKQDVQLWQGDTKLDHNAPLPVLMTANKVSMALENQKNGQKGKPLTHHSTGDSRFCPVKATTRRLDHLRGLPPTTPLCTYWDTKGKLMQLRPNAVKPTVQAAALATGLTPDKGYAPEQIGAHSIRASGAMALKLNGVDDTLIKALGRWSSDTFQRYIRPQISNITIGIASLMTNSLQFSYTH
jgi:hypothetical protein